MKNKEKVIEKKAPTFQSSKRTLIIVTATILAVALVCLTVATVIGFAKNRVKDPVMEYDGAKLPLTFYSLMLTKTKASLARAGYDVTDIKFWNAESTEKGKTNAEYYTERTLETCKLYLLSVYLFDKEGLKLPESYYATIEDEISTCIELSYVGNGSEDKFNEILSRYGLDIDSYREALIIKAKAEYLQVYLFGENGSKIGAELKDEYYEGHYYRFKQILVKNYYYEYESDAYGEEIYFTPDMTKPLYDSKNGVVAFDEDKQYLVDEYGEKIYFAADENGEPILDKPLYDKENGTRQPVCDKDGAPIRHEYSDAQMQERYKIATDVLDKVKAGNYSAFEAEMKVFNDAADSAALNPDGFYLNDITSDGYMNYDYLNKLLAALKEMSAGDREIVETSEGYHVIMRYELDDGAYDDSDKSAWFDNFNATIMTEVFKARYKDILQNIEINEENLQKAESIKIAGINYDYWK